MWCTPSLQFVRNALACTAGATTITLVSPAALAQDFGYIDQNGAPAAPTPGSFQTLAPTQALEPGALSLGLRSTYLLAPIGGSQPSPSPEGTSTRTVEHAWLTEFLVGVGVLPGLDVGVAIPVYLYEQGAGLTPIGVGEPLAPTAWGDPRLTLGYALPLPVELRTYATVFVPLGDAPSFAGEENARLELGAALAHDFDKLRLEVDVAARLRETSSIAQTTWGPQARLGLAVGYLLGDDLLISGELTFAPTLAAQPPAGNNERSGYLFPAEADLTLRYQLDSWSFGALIGTGLPLSVASSQSPEASMRRGPTSPLLRAGIDIRKAF